MKLAAIYNAWDGIELLKGSIDCIKDHVDVVIIVYQKTSNFGEAYNPLPEINRMINGSIWNQVGTPFITLKEFVPEKIGGMFNEKEKRNIGLRVAREFGCTHFLHLDCDEYYKNFAEAKKMYIDSGKKGSVCKLYTYFKHPTYRFANADNYFVPFIHKLTPETVAGGQSYPFYVDPTRKINETDVTELPIFMHHFSYIRRNIDRKVRNSSAKKNIEQSSVMEDYYSEVLKTRPEGFFIKFFEQSLIVVENYFNINL